MSCRTKASWKWVKRPDFTTHSHISIACSDDRMISLISMDYAALIDRGLSSEGDAKKWDFCPIGSCLYHTPFPKKIPLNTREEGISNCGYIIKKTNMQRDAGKAAIESRDEKLYTTAKKNICHSGSFLLHKWLGASWLSSPRNDVLIQACDEWLGAVWCCLYT